MVSKYKEYIHDNRLEIRRIVLDTEMLSEIQRAGNIRIVTPNDLLERFLATVRSACQLAVSNQESVLILIFGHSDEDTYGVAADGEAAAVSRLLSRPLSGPLSRPLSISFEVFEVKVLRSA